MTTAGLDIEIVGDGRGLVLLHSLLTDRTSYATLAERLAPERRMILVNLPGFGSSPPAEPLDGYVEAVAGLFDDLELPPETDVLGNGLGGFVGLKLAIRHGAMFNKLVLIGSAIAFPEPARAAFRMMAEKAEAVGMAPLADTAMLRMFPQDYIDTHPDMIADRKTVFDAIDPAVFAAACRALSTLDLAPELDRIDKPVLIVVGERDQATPPLLGRALAAALRDPEITVLRGAGHAPHIQAPDELLKALAPFLA